MEKLNMQTADAAEQNILRITRLFPGCATEPQDTDGTLRHAVDFDKLHAGLGEEQILPEMVVEAISKLRPLYAVVREPQDDATMTNFDELFKTNSPDTHRRII